MLNTASNPQIPLSILKRVVSDDAFRAELETNAAAALSQYGLEIDPARLPDKINLPDSALLHQTIQAFGDPEMGDNLGSVRQFHGFFARS